MNGKRLTIYDLAVELGISASYVSRALNDHPSVSKKIKDLVKQKAAELNYKHNSHAASLRQGSSKILGVVVPHINQNFFSDVIAGIEEVCTTHKYNLIICQSQESFEKERLAVETLIHQNVDCILISISAETQSGEHLQEVMNHGIKLIQFDRCFEKLDSFKVVNNNKEASYAAVNNLIQQRYKRIAFIGGPTHIRIFQDRKEGYLKAIKEAELNIPYNFIIDNALSRDAATKAARELLSLKDPPDAIFAISDIQSLVILQVADSMGVKVPKQLGIFGFANEPMSELMKPTLSTVNQKSKDVGKYAAEVYFKQMLADNGKTKVQKKTVPCEIIVRESSSRLAK